MMRRSPGKRPAKTYERPGLSEDEIEEIRWIDVLRPDVPLAISIEEEMLPQLITDFID